MKQEYDTIQYTHLLNTIGLIRDSFTGSDVIYTNGSCVKFCMILKHIYPNGNILYDQNHAIFEYDGKCFDINGFADKTEQHIKIEDYGVLFSYQLMNLKYEPKMSSKKAVISRLITVINKYWHEGNRTKLLFYAMRLVSVLSNPL